MCMYCFFFKQKTAYDMRISDWSSDVCSSDLELEIVARPASAFELGTSLAYTDAKLKSVVAGVPAAQVGDRLPGSAKFTAYAYGEYGVSVGADAKLTVRADYSYTGRQFADLGNFNNATAVSYGDYSEVGARATLQIGRAHV